MRLRRTTSVLLGVLTVSTAALVYVLQNQPQEQAQPLQGDVSFSLNEGDQYRCEAIGGCKWTVQQGGGAMMEGTYYSCQCHCPYNKDRTKGDFLTIGCRDWDSNYALRNPGPHPQWMSICIKKVTSASDIARLEANTNYSWRDKQEWSSQMCEVEYTGYGTCLGCRYDKPAECTTSAQCGTGKSCQGGTCYPTNCTQESDCDVAGEDPKTAKCVIYSQGQPGYCQRQGCNDWLCDPLCKDKSSGYPNLPMVSVTMCNADSPAFSPYYGSWTPNGGKAWYQNDYQYATSMEQFEDQVDTQPNVICPDKIFDQSCTMLGGDPYAFTTDGAECASDSDCFRGSDFPNDRPYPSKCLEETIYQMPGVPSSGSSTRKVCKPVTQFCGDGTAHTKAQKDADPTPDDGVDEQCDLGAENGKPTVDCSSQCKIRCGDNQCDANECATTVSGKLKCESDCWECADGCNNDGDTDPKDSNPATAALIDTAEEIGCWMYKPEWAKGGQVQDHKPKQAVRSDNRNETMRCPSLQGPALKFRVVGQLWIKDGSPNMCVPKHNFGACALSTDSNPSTTSPYQQWTDPTMRWPAIETCCRAQAEYLVNYMCDNSTKDNCTLKPGGGNGGPGVNCQLCSNAVKKAMVEEIVAECACLNAGGPEAGESAINLTMDCEKGRAGDLPSLAQYPINQNVCPEQCNNGSYDVCGECLGAGVDVGNATKASYCRIYTINNCVAFSSSTANSTASQPASAGTSASTANSQQTSTTGSAGGNAGSTAGGTNGGGGSSAGTSQGQSASQQNSGHSANPVGGSASSSRPSSGSSKTSSSSLTSSAEASIPTSSSNGSLGYCCQPDKVCRRAPGCTLELFACLLECAGTGSASSAVQSSVAQALSSTSRSSVVSSTLSSSTSRNLVSATSRSSSSSTRSGTSASVRSSSRASNQSSQSRQSVSSVLITTFTQSSAANETLPSACLGNECGIGGSQFCALSGQTCATTNDLPCIRCVGEQLAYTCSGQECAIGGDQFCGLTGTSCVIDNTLQQCFRCAGASSSASAYACNGNECSLGGDQFCGLSGATCVQDSGNQQCFSCLKSSSAASVVIAQQISSVGRVSSRPLIQIADEPAFCGNGITEAGEQCDDGEENANTPNACRPNCTLSRCGDGIPDTPIELCDDGNTYGGDGCSSTCQLERNAPETLPAQIIDLPFKPVVNNPQPQPTNINPSQASQVAGQQYAVPPANADTGPAALAVMISGAAAGYAFMRRRR